MLDKLIIFRIFLIALGAAVAVTLVKYLFHMLNWEPIEQSSLHNGVISSATFVIGFILSATIADYKESERIPADFAANLEDIYTDAQSIHDSYPKFDLNGLQKQLIAIAHTFDGKARKGSHGVSKEIRALSPFFAQMEKAGVPANFVVKLKQQQVTLLKHRKRISYIQRIRFIPSGTVLARSIVGLVIGLLILTNVDPFYGSLAIIAIISFVMVYIMILIDTISYPFHEEGKTKDDVSMFLIYEAADFIEKSSSKTSVRKTRKK